MNEILTLDHADCVAAEWVEIGLRLVNVVIVACH